MEQYRFMNYPITHFKFQFRSDYKDILPPELWDLPKPPENLYIQGSPSAFQILKSLPERGIAVVGTRTPQPRSIALIKSKIAQWTGTQLILISGLARGIDTVAHSAALDAGIPTLAILGAGLDLCYPRENEELRKRILQSNGLIVSEFPLGTPALGYRFLQRNRIIAGWSKATWVVEASHRSGSLNTARWARDQNRVCLATPCYPGDPALAGNQLLIDRDHAVPFWENHSLGMVWFELATHFHEKGFQQKGIHEKRRSNAPEQGQLFNKEHDKEHDITQHVKNLTYQQGGSQVHELLDWAISKNWTPEEFFAVFERAIAKKYIQNQKGVLVSL